MTPRRLLATALLVAMLLGPIALAIPSALNTTTPHPLAHITASPRPAPLP